MRGREEQSSDLSGGALRQIVERSLPAAPFDVRFRPTRGRQMNAFGRRLRCSGWIHVGRSKCARPILMVKPARAPPVGAVPARIP